MLMVDHQLAKNVYSKNELDEEIDYDECLSCQ